MAHHKMALLALLAAALCVSGAYANEKECEPIPAWDQCGGAGGTCGQQPHHKCADYAYPGCRCVEGYECAKQNEWYYQCVPRTTPTPSPPAKCTIPEWGECKPPRHMPMYGEKGDDHMTQDSPKGDNHMPQDGPKGDNHMPQKGGKDDQHMPQDGPKGDNHMPQMGGKGGDRMPKDQPFPSGDKGDDRMPKHGGKGGHGDGDCPCVWGTKCMKVGREFVWKCMPETKPSPNHKP